MFPTSFKVGFFLAVRQLRRSSPWTTILTISVMTFTFLNLVVITGILVGLIEGSSKTYRQQHSGDILITNLATKQYIASSQENLNIIASLPEVDTYTARYLEGGQIEANYKDVRRSDELGDVITAQFSGIDPIQEDRVTNISNSIIRGEYLNPEEEGFVLIGANLLSEFTPDFAGIATLDNVDVGDKLRITINGITKEVIVKGIVFTKAGPSETRLHFNSKELRRLIGRTDFNVDEIAVRLKPNADPVKVKRDLLASGLGADATVQTWEESQGQFFEDIRNTFNMLGTAFSAIGLVVASITIFIVVFINAITRQKYIGILKGIGVSESAIETSYIIQSIFYAVSGVAIGFIILYWFLAPYIDANPIDFPFSDGILVAPLGGTLIRSGILVATTILAGFIPARMIINKNTLDAILGR